MNIELKILNTEFYNEYSIPKYATSGSAAIDLICMEDILLYPTNCKLIGTGLAINMIEAPNMAALIMPRSGLGHKGLILGNSIGLIDSDYQGEIKVSVLNRNIIPSSSSSLFPIMISLTKGERFAQLMFIPIVKPNLTIVKEFTTLTARGEGGWGSTNTLPNLNIQDS